MNDTIYALATPLGHGIAIIRVSGPRAEEVITHFFSHKGTYDTHHLYYGHVIVDGTIIDESMAVLMRAPNSYTAEDCVEFHCHGSRAIVKTLLSALSRYGLRIADPGEFSRRAFENGRIDLAQAEAVMDLIHSDAERSAQAALDQLQGHLSNEIVQLQDNLTDAIAELEAMIDYPEEDWLEETWGSIDKKLTIIRDHLFSILKKSEHILVLREGFKIAFIGRPNAGKSTLFNVLLGTDRAIVTQYAGTTRDILEETIVIDGYPVRLIDTAGLHDTEDVIEQIGIERTNEQMDRSDLVFVLLDTSSPLTAEDIALLERTQNRRRCIVLTKNDLPPQWDLSSLSISSNDHMASISAKTESGIQDLQESIASIIAEQIPSEMHSSLLHNQRHIDAVQQAYQFMEDALQSIKQGDMDCVSIDARRAWSSLGEITGLTIDEDIIDRIFSTFCLGK